MSVLETAFVVDAPAVISDEVGGETLAINLTTGAYFVIPPSALGVWRAVSGGVPAARLATACRHDGAAFRGRTAEVHIAPRYRLAFRIHRGFRSAPTVPISVRSRDLASGSRQPD